MVKRNNLLLIIEDIDRLPNDGYMNILRICSCINSYENRYKKLKRPIGIIAVSEDNIVKKGVNGIKNKKVAQRQFNDLKNKIFPTEIAKDYDSNESKIKYLRSVCFVAHKILSLERPNDIRKLKILKEIYLKNYANNLKISANFRDIHKLLEDLLYIKSKDLSELEYNEIKEDLEKKFSIIIK